MQADNAKKDQSYVLWQLTRSQIDRAYFPLGGYTKDEVRAFAAQNGLFNAEKRTVRIFVS